MSRAKYQVLVIPYMVKSNSLYFAVLKRSDSQSWQFIAGGGEGDETPCEAAKRESYEEAGIDILSRYIKLDCTSTVPVFNFSESSNWPSDLYVIPEYCFAVEVQSKLFISDEHLEYNWVNYEDASKILKWDSNRTALWEVMARFKADDLK